MVKEVTIPNTDKKITSTTPSCSGPIPAQRLRANWTLNWDMASLFKD